MLRTVSAALIGLFLSFVLISGALSHALIPHSHGDHHAPGEGAMWQALHSSLRHEDKQALPVFTVVTVVGAVIVALMMVARTEPVFVLPQFELLRRGIAPHRRFG